jgi:pimeloyl-ACP methyl ester carboxylesterase
MQNKKGLSYPSSPVTSLMGEGVKSSTPQPTYKYSVIVIIIILNFWLAACNSATSTVGQTTQGANITPATGQTQGSAPTTTAGQTQAVAATPTTRVPPTVASTGSTITSGGAQPTQATSTINPATLKPSGQFATAKCPMPKIPGDLEEGKAIICGYLTVPEDHSKPQGKTIKLAVVTLKGTNTGTNPPLVFLQGGPGGGAIEQLEVFTGAEYPDKRLLQGRDIVVIDQRGTGFSQPTLKCQEAIEVENKYLGKPSNKQIEQEALAAYTACRERLAKEGINLGVYNTIQNAADIEALRLGLKLDKMDLYGVSYGSRLALTVMRDYPAGVRSTIISSVVPLQADIAVEQRFSFSNALEEFFKTCEGDASCKQKYPTLRADFDKAYNDLKAKPLIKQASNPLKGTTLELTVDGEVFLTTVYYLLYTGNIILPQIPLLINFAAKGNVDLLSTLYVTIVQSISDSISAGTYYSTNCSDEYSFSNPNNAPSQTLLPSIKDGWRSNGNSNEDPEVAICKLWNVPKAPAIENQPVKSDIPTLIINGKFDPITPPNYGAEAAKTLSKSTSVTLANAGHAPDTLNECATDIRLEFLANPAKAPNLGCAARLKVTF